jgi:hypothetical protein
MHTCPHTHRPRSLLNPLVLAATMAWSASACGDSDAVEPVDTSDTSLPGDVGDTTPGPTTSRFLGVVLTDDISPRGVAGATVRTLDDPDAGPFTTDTFGFFEADVPNDRAYAWHIESDDFMPAIVVMPAQLSDSDGHYPLTLRTPAQLARHYELVATTGAPEPVAGRAHVVTSGGYPQLQAWAGGLTVEADMLVVYPPWLDEAPAAPRNRADQRVPMAWLPNIDPTVETVAFTMRDRFDNPCYPDPLVDTAAPFAVPVRADTITTVAGYCRFPEGYRPLEGNLVESTEEDFRVTRPAVGVEICVDGEDACATTDTDGNFYLAAKDEPMVTLRLAEADELPVLWPRARPETGWFDARGMFRELNPAPTSWTSNYPPEEAGVPFDSAFGAAYGAGADISVPLDVPVGDVVVRVDSAETFPWYASDDIEDGSMPRSWSRSFGRRVRFPWKSSKRRGSGCPSGRSACGRRSSRVSATHCPSVSARRRRASRSRRASPSGGGPSRSARRAASASAPTYRRIARKTSTTRSRCSCTVSAETSQPTASATGRGWLATARSTSSRGSIGGREYSRPPSRGAVGSSAGRDAGAVVEPELDRGALEFPDGDGPRVPPVAPRGVADGAHRVDVVGPRRQDDQPALVVAHLAAACRGGARHPEAREEGAAVHPDRDAAR